MAENWTTTKVDDVQPGDVVRYAGQEFTVARVDPNFLGREQMVCLIEDTPERFRAGVQMAEPGWLFVLRAFWPHRDVLLDGVPVEIVPEASGPCGGERGDGVMVIDLPGDRRVRVDRHVDTDALRRVLLALGATAPPGRGASRSGGLSPRPRCTGCQSPLSTRAASGRTSGPARLRRNLDHASACWDCSRRM